MQDIKRFRNAPYWRERFGDSSVDKRRFKWTRFYEAVADKLLFFRNRRDELISGIHAIASKVEGLSNLQDQFVDGSSGPLKDICPFTTMGIFNRGITDINRKAIASQLANLLGVSEPVPDSFEGIPILNNQQSWFFGFDNKRQPDDIDALWEVFAQAIDFAESDDADVRSAFVAAYDNTVKRYGVGWNLTMGLYWIRPWNFPTLDGKSQRYIGKKLNIQIGMNGPKGRCNASDYLTVLDTLEARFQEDAYPVHSFPELSLTAWRYRPPEQGDEQNSHWRKSVLEKISQICRDKNSSEFTRQEFLGRFLSDLEEEFPNNNTIQSTVNRQFQILRDEELIEFVSRGSYRLLVSDAETEPETSEKEILTAAPLRTVFCR